MRHIWTLLKSEYLKKILENDMMYHIIFGGFVLEMMFIIFIGMLILIPIYRKLKECRFAEERLREEWGKPGARSYTKEQLHVISEYFQNEPCENALDEITWQDLSMDQFFQRLDTTHSAVGQEYLYRMLRTPAGNSAILEQREAVVSVLSGEQEERIALLRLFQQLGFCGKYSAYSYLQMLSQIPTASNLHHYILLLLLGASIVFMLLGNSAIGIFIFLGMLAFCIADYYRYKGRIEPFYRCINYVMRMSRCSDSISRLKLMNSISNSLKRYANLFSKERKALQLFASGTINPGSLLDMLMDYVRMITHMDLIVYNQIATKFINNKSEIHNMYQELGFIEAMLAVSNFRTTLTMWCKPEYQQFQQGFETTNLYHPLIANPVSNSIAAKKGILITGSNASGKSTFLRTVAINAIMAQTLNTCCAASYKAPMYRIFSSLSLQDNLQTGESYFIVEIKALHRIFLSSKKQDLPVLCFVDEVLRGTNTVERIAASTQLLKELARLQVLCFAATHDIELTWLLKGDYDNYHFEEEVQEDGIFFSYELLEGPAHSRNALKLLKQLDFDSQIIQQAEEMAEQFIESGKW